MLGRANAYPCWCMNVILVHFLRRRPDGVRPWAPAPASLTYDPNTMLCHSIRKPLATQPQFSPIQFLGLQYISSFFHFYF